ncbi:MAG: hypothetical protein KTR29_09730 [Rhodothermaceae bacterium]|nr:hypothetical protein [Rhodothermaceae bacterium]
MEPYTDDVLVVEKEEILVEATQASTDDFFADTVMQERAELFLALIAKVNEPEVSYINEHSWLFGKG